MTKDEKLIKIKEISANNQQLKKLASEAEALDARLMNLEDEAKDLRESIAEPLKAIKESVKEVKAELSQNRYATNRLIKGLLGEQDLQACFFDIPEFTDSTPVAKTAPTIEISDGDLEKVSKVMKSKLSDNRITDLSIKRVNF